MAARSPLVKNGDPITIRRDQERTHARLAREKKIARPQKKRGSRQKPKETRGAARKICESWSRGASEGAVTDKKPLREKRPNRSLVVGIW